MRTYLLLLVAALPCGSFGQSVSLGVIGGGSLTDAVQGETAVSIPGGPVGTRWWSQSKDWVAGVALEYRFHSALSLEVDGLYRELHATWASVESDGTLNSVSPSPVVTWEFPVMGKYMFGGGRWRPFVEAGPSFRTTGNLNFTPSHFGVSAGVGVETKWRGLRIAPVVRYTRWRPDVGFGPSLSQLNQLEMLVSVSHAPESSGSPFGSRVGVGMIAGWGLTSDVSPSTASYQLSYIGAGNTVTTVNETQYVSRTTSPSIGAAVEVRVAGRLSLEVDALHKPLREQTKIVFSNGTTYGPATYTQYTTWEFPVLAKYRFELGKVAPFLEAGPSFRLPVPALSSYGATGGAGIERRWRFLRVAPAVRFTRWGSPAQWAAGQFPRNEAVAMVGLWFGGAGAGK